MVGALADRTVLVVDDDPLAQRRVGRGLALRGFEPILAGSVTCAMTALRSSAPAFAVIEPRLSDGTGLAVVEALRRARPDSRVVVLTSHGSIAAAVAAVKAGVVDYLTKPADADDVTRALVAADDEAPPPPESPMSAARVRWEHIHRVYELCGHNVSETARRLRMHRRTLQRILQKRAPQ
ncbi:MAG TPA: ActR/PrrA/RegA family redox response regulator transcription factor [Caulobacteraceae bacterium]|nr:ActR/PrrA/RegA family redox response regulator transcription factor [Caulobacteraceae bacterium]